jgi:hypothetical protein
MMASGASVIRHSEIFQVSSKVIYGVPGFQHLRLVCERLDESFHLAPQEACRVLLQDSTHPFSGKDQLRSCSSLMVEQNPDRYWNRIFSRHSRAMATKI